MTNTTTMQQFGAVFGIAVATTVFNAHGSLASAARVTSGYRPALALAAALSVAGALTALALRRSPGQVTQALELANVSHS